MATKINDLSQVDTLAAGDAVPVYDASNGGTRQAPVSVVQEYMQDNLTFNAAEVVTEYWTPGVTGWSGSVADVLGSNVWVIIKSTGGSLATGTIILPALATLADKQEITFTGTGNVIASVTLTIDGNGATVDNIGMPTKLPDTAAYAINGFTIRYHAALQTWYRVE